VKRLVSAAGNNIPERSGRRPQGVGNWDAHDLEPRFGRGTTYPLLWMKVALVSHFLCHGQR
jgi:hypothetical protein